MGTRIDQTKLSKDRICGEVSGRQVSRYSSIYVITRVDLDDNHDSE